MHADHLAVRYHTERPAQPSAGRFPLAAVHYGNVTDRTEWNDCVSLDVPLDVLGSGALELWTTGTQPTVERAPGLQLAWTEQVLFGAVDVDGDDLEASTRDSHARMFDALRGLEFEHLTRVWHVVPHINREDAGLERYQRFCRARAEVTQAYFGEHFEPKLCASSAVGSHRGPQVLYFIATRSAGGRHIENERQMSAFVYPAQYGPRSPSFARATEVPEALGDFWFLSGTASITGHLSRHAGDTHEQLLETLRNLSALIAERNTDEIELDGEKLPLLKVFVKHERDAERIEAELRRQLGSSTQILSLHADICRAELLLEIEGLARVTTSAAQR